MSGDAPVESASDEGRPLPLVELDRALAPIRRLASWASADPAGRGAAVPYAEATVGRWVRAALAHELPGPLSELIAAQRDAMSGYDGATAEGRAERLAALHQAVCRADALLGLPLHGVPIRRPRKPRLPDWRVEERAPAPAAEADQGEEPKAARRPRSADEAPPRRAKRGAQQAPPPAPFWNGRVSEAVLALDLPPEILQALDEAGVATVGELLFLPPTGTTRLKPVHGAGRAIPDGEERAAVGGRVLHRRTVLGPDGSRQVRVALKGAGPADLVWATGADSLEAAGGVAAYEPGSRVIAVGRPVAVDGVWELHDCERAFDDGAGGVRLRDYGLAGVSDVWLRGILGRLVPLADNLRDLLPGAELTRTGQEPIRGLLPELHHRDLDRARRRLAFDEALLVQLGLALTRYRTSRDRGLSLAPHHGMAAGLAQTHGMELDDAGQAALEDIKRDLHRRTPMRRVLAGRVGSGRGLVSLIAAVAVAEGKVQVLVLSPDADEAEQRYLFAALALREVGLVARLVEGSPNKAVRDAVGRGEIHVLFGTLDLLDAELEFRRLGLIIAEEREALGRASAAVARIKAPRPHLLVIPSTPVTPRLALTAYSDHDVTMIAGGAPEPGVSLVPEAERAVVYGRAAEVVGAGGQVVMLFPQVKGEDALDLREAWRLVKALEADAFGKARMGLFHGAMSREDRLQAYEDLERRRVDVMVATAPIEGGPPPAGARMLVLEQAERFSPHRLARLRGYLRPESGDVALWCVCAADPADARDRLLPLVEPMAWHEQLALSADRTAEDAPALPELKWVDLERDAALVWQARDVAHRLLARDPRLRSGWAADVGRALRDRWTGLYGEDAPALNVGGELAATPGTEGAQSKRRTGGRRRRRRRKR